MDSFSQTSATSWRRFLFSLYHENKKLKGQQDKTAFELWDFTIKVGI